MCSLTVSTSSITNPVLCKVIVSYMVLSLFYGLSTWLRIRSGVSVKSRGVWGWVSNLEETITLRGCTWSRRLQQKSYVPVGCRSRILGVSCLAGLQLRREMRGESSIEVGNA